MVGAGAFLHDFRPENDNRTRDDNQNASNDSAKTSREILGLPWDPDIEKYMAETNKDN